VTQALAAVQAADARATASASIALRTLAAAIVSLFALNNILLLGFVGLSPLLVTALALILPPMLALLTWRAVPDSCRIRLATIFACILIAALLLMLGGEGRLFYAPPDWQVRDAVLADMGMHRWPFDYWLDGRSQILRAPIGMYLLPALVGGASQFGRDWTLFAQNSLLLGLLLAIGSPLFEERRARWIALAVFLTFSGLDVLGNFLVQWATGGARWDNIEDWADGYQYSAHITQLFWVPQHALAGWTVALTYLLWRRGFAPIGLFAASLPLVALWSPLVLFGAMPFALFAGLRALLTRGWNGRDLLLCGIAAALALPAFIYMSVDAAAVGGGLNPPKPIIYVLLLLLEVIPFLLPALRDDGPRSDRATMLITGACLFLMPCWTIGMFNDFQMRASIMPLALLALAFADMASRVEKPRARFCFLIIVALASVTGGIGIANAFRFASSPAPLCSLPGVWDRQTGLKAPHASYFASRDAFPLPVLPRDRVSNVEPPHCWDRPWRTPAATNRERQGRS
jgi:hypothetical protein